VTVTAPNQPPTANFTSSCSGLTCNFTSTSNDPDGLIASYSWAFGDGGTSAAQNPSHTYAGGGGYTVTLTVTDNQGATSAPTSKSVTVTAPNQPPTANFTSSCSALTCDFTSTSSDPDGSIASYSWAFGDGGTSIAQNPSHTYATGGRYGVTLTVADNQGATSAPASKSVTIVVPLVFTVQPSNAPPYPLGTIQPPVQVTAVDALGNRVMSYTGLVTIAIGRNAGVPEAGTLRGTNPVAAVNGVATFSDLSIDRPGIGYTLLATASGLTGAESGSFTILTPLGVP